VTSVSPLGSQPAGIQPERDIEPGRGAGVLHVQSYYGVTTPEFFVSVTLAHLGYAGLVFAYTLDFVRRDLHEETLVIPLGRGIHLPRNSDRGEATFDNGRVQVAFRLVAGGRQMQLHWPAFRHGQGLSARLLLRQRPEHESMAIVIPIGRRRFYYNRKMNCLPAQGWVLQGDRRTEVRPTDSLGNLDWGRGVWEYESFWVWASASAFLPDGRTLGLNLGTGFGDTRAATENAIVLEGRIHKLGAVQFDYDPDAFMHPWHMAAPYGRLDLTFVPFSERIARSNVVLVASEVHQMFGHYRGTLVTDDGETIQIRDLVGFAEEHHARW
jgi:hypothetical protein